MFRENRPSRPSIVWRGIRRHYFSVCLVAFILPEQLISATRSRAGCYRINARIVALDESALTRVRDESAPLVLGERPYQCQTICKFKATTKCCFRIFSVYCRCTSGQMFFYQTSGRHPPNISGCRVNTCNKRAPFRFHDANRWFIDQCLSRTWNLAASNQTYPAEFFSGRSWPNIRPAFFCQVLFFL